MADDALHERLATVAGNQSFREIARQTGLNAETVRRYMQGQAPSAEFLVALCKTLGINAEWLLLGKGPMRADDIHEEALKAASAGDLLIAMSGNIEGLVGRVGRIERYMQMLEVQLRGNAKLQTASNTATAIAGETDEGDATDEQGPSGSDTTRARARKIGDAVAERPPPAAD
ncbi:MAG: helix-turn-helix transcriptional regulator [Planctomycetota bacterium]